MKTILQAAVAAALLSGTAANAQPSDPKVQARIDRILKRTPLIDGHNDIAEQLAENYKRSIAGLASGTGERQPRPLMTDMARLHQGRVGGILVVSSRAHHRDARSARPSSNRIVRR